MSPFSQRIWTSANESASFSAVSALNLVHDVVANRQRRRNISHLRCKSSYGAHIDGWEESMIFARVLNRLPLALLVLIPLAFGPILSAPATASPAPRADHVLLIS